MSSGRTGDRLDLTGVATSPDTFARARQIIDRSGIYDLLYQELYTRPGRSRREDLKGFLVACQVNALHRAHTEEITSITCVMNGFTDAQRKVLGIGDWSPEKSYDRVDRLFNDIARLDEGGVVARDPARLDGMMHAIGQAIVDASISSRHRVSTAVAVDGTDIETFAASRFKDSEIVLDGEPGPSDEEAKARREPRRTPVSYGTDAHGRKICTKDPDARSGHRSATNSRSSEFYVGYELHAVVQTREVEIHDPVGRALLGPVVPPLIRCYALTEAGAHRARTCRKILHDANTSRWKIRDVVADRGMTMGVDEWQMPLRKAGYRPFFDLHANQRIIKPSKAGPVIVDGHPFSRATPSRILGSNRKPLPVPPRGISKEDRMPYHQAFAERAEYSFRAHSSERTDGTRRFKGPFARRRLRSQELPETMRRPEDLPLVDLPEHWGPGDDGVITIAPKHLPLYQPAIYGTLAWATCYTARRQVVESAFAGLKEAKADIGNKGHFKVFGRHKLTLLVAFDIAAYNIRRATTFDSEAAAAQRAADEADGKRPGRRRRRGTYDDVQDPLELEGPTPSEPDDRDPP